MLTNLNIQLFCHVLDLLHVQGGHLLLLLLLQNFSDHRISVQLFQDQKSFDYFIIVCALQKKLFVPYKL